MFGGSDPYGGFGGDVGYGSMGVADPYGGFDGSYGGYSDPLGGLTGNMDSPTGGFFGGGASGGYYGDGSLAGATGNMDAPTGGFFGGGYGFDGGSLGGTTGGDIGNMASAMSGGYGDPGMYGGSLAYGMGGIDSYGGFDLGGEKGWTPASEMPGWGSVLSTIGSTPGNTITAAPTGSFSLLDGLYSLGILQKDQSQISGITSPSMASRGGVTAAMNAGLSPSYSPSMASRGGAVSPFGGYAGTKGQVSTADTKGDFLGGFSPSMASRGGVTAAQGVASPKGDFMGPMAGPFSPSMASRGGVTAAQASTGLHPNTAAKGDFLGSYFGVALPAVASPQSAKGAYMGTRPLSSYAYGAPPYAGYTPVLDKDQRRFSDVPNRAAKADMLAGTPANFGSIPLGLPGPAGPARVGATPVSPVRGSPVSPVGPYGSLSPVGPTNPNSGNPTTSPGTPSPGLGVTQADIGRMFDMVFDNLGKAADFFGPPPSPHIGDGNLSSGSASPPGVPLFQTTGQVWSDISGGGR